MAETPNGVVRAKQSTENQMSTLEILNQPAGLLQFVGLPDWQQQAKALQAQAPKSVATADEMEASRQWRGKAAKHAKVLETARLEKTRQIDDLKKTIMAKEKEEVADLTNAMTIAANAEAKYLAEVERKRAEEARKVQEARELASRTEKAVQAMIDGVVAKIKAWDNAEQAAEGYNTIAKRLWAPKWPANIDVATANQLFDGQYNWLIEQAEAKRLALLAGADTANVVEDAPQVSAYNLVAAALPEQEPEPLPKNIRTKKVARFGNARYVDLNQLVAHLTDDQATKVVEYAAKFLTGQPVSGIAYVTETIIPTA